jgi:hypothetical protein
MTSQETKIYLEEFIRPLIQKRKRKSNLGGLFSGSYRTSTQLKTGMYIIKPYMIRVWNESGSDILINIVDLKSFREYESFKEE